MYAIHRPKLVIRIVNIFSQINQFINRLQNFISLNLKAKSMRYALFFSRSKRQKLKTPVKNLARLLLGGGI